ncbi:MAG: insulinase family protein [Bacteroidetes bacterium]|nr:insulinase family protein [Bacteroidota bacterium]
MATVDESNHLFGKTDLHNGVRVVTETIPSVRSVSVGAWIEAGSRDEIDEDAGMCHFIEHMVFKGTKTRRMHQIAERMESVGGYLNAFTTKEYTCYYARALDEHLDRSIETVTDLILVPTFPSKELEKEKDVVIEEMRMYEDTPEDYAFDLLDKVLYDEQSMGRPIIGLESSVRSCNRDRLLDYVKSHYTPNRTIIAVVGNVRHDKVVRLVEKSMGQARRVSERNDRSPLTTGQSETIRVRKPIQQAHLILGTRSYSVHHPHRFALSVLNTILGGGMSSLLNQNIREKYGYCYNIYSFLNAHSDTGEFGVYMGTDASRIDRARKLLIRELNRLVQDQVSARKLKQAINQVKGSIMLGLESMGSRMMRIGRQELYYHRYYSLDEIIERIESVTASEILTVAQDLLDPDRFSLVELIPDART